MIDKLFVFKQQNKQHHLYSKFTMSTHKKRRLSDTWLQPTCEGDALDYKALIERVLHLSHGLIGQYNERDITLIPWIRLRGWLTPRQCADITSYASERGVQVLFLGRSKIVVPRRKRCKLQHDVFENYDSGDDRGDDYHSSECEISECDDNESDARVSDSTLHDTNVYTGRRGGSDDGGCEDDDHKNNIGGIVTGNRYGEQSSNVDDIGDCNRPDSIDDGNVVNVSQVNSNGDATDGDAIDGDATDDNVVDGNATDGDAIETWSDVDTANIPDIGDISGSDSDVAIDTVTDSVSATKMPWWMHQSDAAVRLTFAHAYAKAYYDRIATHCCLRLMRAKSKFSCIK